MKTFKHFLHNTHPAFSHFSSNPNRLVGSGSFAYVHQKDDGHHEDEVVRTSVREEITALFLEYVSNLDNPYFPKVRSYEHGEDFSNVIAERLYPFKRFKNNTKIMLSTYDSIFRKSFEEEYGQVNDDVDFGYGLVDNIRSAIEHEQFDRIKDENFMEAIHCLHDFSRIYSGIAGQTIEFDIYPNNLMWRMGNLIPHIVITDPVYDPHPYS